MLWRCGLRVFDEIQPGVDLCDGAGQADRHTGGIGCFGEARPPVRMDGQSCGPAARWGFGSLCFGGAGAELPGRVLDLALPRMGAEPPHLAQIVVGVTRSRAISTPGLMSASGK
jgi:hypothetical protein